MFGFIATIKGFLSVILTVLNFLSFGIFGDFTAETKPLYDDCKVNFAVISDIHMTEEKARADMLRFGLQDMQESESPLDALICSGDLTDHGEPEEWANLERAFADYTPAKNIILAQGNHDTWTGDDDYALSRELFIEYNEKIADREIDEVYYSTKINGYTFIVLGTDTAEFEESYFNEAQLNWLDEELAKSTADGKPAFVVCHQSLKNTHGLPDTWNSPSETAGTVGPQSDDLKEIMNKYENVIMISGHLHTGIGQYTYEKIDNFHSINLPSTAIVNKDGDYNNAGIGFVIEAYDNHVLFRARDFAQGKYIPEYDIDIALS